MREEHGARAAGSGAVTTNPRPRRPRRRPAAAFRPGVADSSFTGRSLGEVPSVTPPPGPVAELPRRTQTRLAFFSAGVKGFVKTTLCCSLFKYSTIFLIRKCLLSIWSGDKIGP